jgi:hypothetical protein
MLAKIIMIVEIIVAVVCVIEAMVKVRNYCKNRKELTPQLKLKQHFLSGEFAFANAVFVSKEVQRNGYESRDYLHDSINYSIGSDSILPSVDFGSHHKAYKYNYEEKAPMYRYAIEVDGTVYSLLSKEKSNTLRVYYNKEDPKEIYSMEAIRKAMDWTDKKEKIVKQQEKNKFSDGLIIRAIIVGAILVHLMCF